MKKKCLLIAFFTLTFLYLLMNTNDVSANETNEMPKITILGPSKVYIEKGSNYADAGAMATDVEDGDISGYITDNAYSVDTNIVGTYTVSYSVTDKDYNTSYASRTVIVYDRNLVKNEVNIIRYNSSYSTTSFTDIVATSDGDFIAVGTYKYNSSYSNATMVKLDSNGDVKWENNQYFSSTYGNNNVSKILKAQDGHYYVIGYNSVYDARMLKLTESGTVSANVSLNYDYVPKDMVEYDANKFAILNGNYLEYYNGTSYQKANYLNSVDQIESIGGKIVTYGANTLKMIDTYGSLQWTKYFYDLSLVEMFSYDDKIVLVGNTSNTTNSSIAQTNGSTDGIVIQIDHLGNIVSSQTYGGSLADTFNKVDLVNGLIYVTTDSQSTDGSLYNSNSGVAVIDASTLELVNTSNYETSFTSETAVTANNGTIAVVGSDYQNYYYSQKAAFINQEISIRGLEDLTMTVGSVETFDYSADLEIKNNKGEILPYTTTSIEGNVNPKVVGHHDLVYNVTVMDGETVYHFKISRRVTVEPKLIGIENNGVYEKELLLDIEGGTIKVNDQEYSQNDVYNIPGTSVLTIEGINGYVKEIHFEVLLEVSGLTDEATYEESVTPIISGGTVTLNGEEYISGTKITTPGMNTLTIVGSNYTKTFTFTVNLKVEGLSHMTSYTGSVTPKISGGIVTLNDKPYEIGTEIGGPGTYKLNIFGANNTLVSTYQFTILPEKVNVVDGGIYNGNLIPVVTNGTIKLLKFDGSIYTPVDYVSGDLLKTPGEYQLEISGDGEFYAKYNFTLLEGSNIINHSNYINSVLLEFVGVATLNGVEVESGILVDQIGHYTLIVTGVEEPYQFSVVPDLSDFEEDLYLKHTINIPNATLTLNGNEIENNLLIDEVGKYELVITGVGGYTDTVFFNILPTVNIENESVHQNEVYVEVNGGNITLNGNPFTSEIITEVGNHILVITGKNDYTETITFVIEPQIENIVDGGIYYGSVLPNIGGTNLTLDGQTYENQTEINSLGSHTIRITGPNLYTKEISFFIIPADFPVIENEVYDSSFTITSSELDLLINGEDYTSGDPIEVGAKTITFVDKLGQVATISFYVLPTIEGVKDDEIYYSSVTPVIESENISLTLNNEEFISGTEITTVGSYELVVHFSDGTTYEINFEIRPDLTLFEKEYTGSVTPNIPNVRQMILDGIQYINETEITSVGNHTLTIYGENGYVEEVLFTIHPTITGIINGGVYNESVEIEIQSGTTAYLNNELYYGSQITYAGNYTLMISGANGYVKQITFVIDANLQNVEDLGRYTAPFIPQVTNAMFLYLNGYYFDQGTSINQVGQYQLEIFGNGNYYKVINFTVAPIVTNVEENGIYTDSVTPIISGVTLTLDGTPYTSGTLINTVGNHKLKMEANGYVETIQFTIKETISGIIDGGSESLTISLPQFDTVNLNGTDIDLIDHQLIVDTIGNNILIVTGVNGYTNTYHFVITETVTGIASGITYDGPVYPVVNHDDITLNDVDFNSGTEVLAAGNYQLKVYGVNDYVSKIEFSVKADVENIVSQQIFEGSVIPNVTNASVFMLNDKPYTLGTEIKTVGHHELVIYGLNGYSESILFTVEEVVSGIEAGGSYIGVAVPIISNAELYLDGSTYNSGSDIIEVGYHTITVNGVGGYASRIDFTVKEQLIGINANEVYDYYVSPKIENVVGLFLNGLPYTSNTEINTVGTHYLEVIGVNDYTSTIKFTVKERVNGFVDGEFRLDAVTPVIEHAKKIIVNGQFIELGQSFNQVGEYEVIVEGINGHRNEYSFNILPKVENLEKNGKYTLSVTPIINSNNLKLDGEAYVSGTPITSIGTHTLEILGEGGFEDTYLFSIVDDVQIITGDDGSVTIVNHGSQLTLDGLEYVTGTPIKAIGNYTLKVVSGDYIDFYNITVEPKLSVSEGGDYLGQVNLNYTLTGTFTLNDDSEAFVSGTQITEVGNHVLHIVGVNYQKDVSFTVSPKVVGVTNGEKYDRIDSITTNGIIKMELNGKEYFGEEITTVGNHTLTVYGTNNYTKNITFVISETVTGVDNGVKYSEVVTPTFSSDLTATLNGNIFTQGTPVNKAGNYELVIYGKNGYTSKYSFTVEGDIQISENGEYEGSVTPINNNGVMFIDGIRHDSGVKYSKVGHHELKISGLNGYERIITFTITPKIEGVINGETYDGQVYIKVDQAQLKLNNVDISNSVTLTQVGYHTLTILGSNGYKQDLSFTIEPKVTGIEDEVTYVDSVVINVPNTTLKIDGTTYVQGKIFKEIGNHTLLITGTNGYTKELNFTIKVNDTWLVNDKEYQSSVVFDIPYSDLKIDGVDYENNTAYKEVGNHELTIIGTNGYRETVRFVIKDRNNSVISKTYLDQVVPSIDNATLYLNGELIDNKAPITKIGHHVLTIQGVNGYTNTVEFTVAENLSLKNDMTYQNSVTIKKLNAMMLLNGKEITSDTMINKQGQYKLEIFGEGGYTSTYQFTVKEDLSVAEKRYTEPVLIQKVNAKMFLNGEEVTEDTYANKNGENILEIIGEGGFTETIIFEYDNYNIEKTLIIGIPAILLIVITLLIIKSRKKVI